MGYLKLIIVGIFVFALLAAFSFFKLWQSEQEYRKIEAENNRSMLDSALDVHLKLTEKEMLKYYAKTVQQIADTLNLKPKQIKSFTTNKYYKLYDTAKVALKVQNDTTMTFEKRFDACFYIQGRVDLLNKDIFFDKPIIDYRSTSVYYWEHEKKIWFIKWKRKDFRKSFNNCTGKSVIEEIEVIKK